MDYEQDKKMEEAISDPLLGTKPASIEKRPSPSCMREHMDQLQTSVDSLRKRQDIQDKRILQLEKLIGV